MKLSSASAQALKQRLLVSDVSVAVVSRRANRLLEENDSDSLACDLISFELFGANDATCQCSFAADDAVATGGNNSTDPDDGLNVSITCKEGDAEIDISVKNGELSFMETCARYCDEDLKSDCQRICVADMFFGGADGPVLCTASVDGRVCDSCEHNPMDFGFGSSSWNSWSESYYCPSEDRIDIDCSGVAGQDYARGHMCGHSGNITFEVVDSYSYGYSGGYSSPYSGSSYSGGVYSSSSSSSDDFVSGFLSVVFFIMLIGLRIGLAMRNANVRSELSRNRSPRAIQLSRVRGQNSDGDPVELVLVSLLENNVAFAKESLQDGHKDFQYAVPGSDDSVANELRKFVNESDWMSLRDVLSAIEDNGARSYYFGIVGDEIEKTWPTRRVEDLASFSPMLDEWLETEPDVTVRILRAEVGVHWAWHARSAALAYLVGQHQWQLFHARLKNASSEIDAAKALCPSDPLIYPTAITIKMGLGSRNPDIMSIESCLHALDTVADEPLLCSAHTRALAYYCKKWHGSHEQMFSHARSVTSQLPDGHPLFVLIPMAHVERTMIEGVPGYWSRPSVVNEIRESYARAFPGVAAHTTQATEPAAKEREMTCRNYFAFTLAATGQYEAARHQIRIIGRRPCKGWPWRGGIATYKRIVEALGFDISPPSDDETTHHLTLGFDDAPSGDGETTHHLAHAVATPIGNGNENNDVPLAASVEIV